MSSLHGKPVETELNYPHTQMAAEGSRRNNALNADQIHNASMPLPPTSKPNKVRVLGFDGLHATHRRESLDTFEFQVVAGLRA